MKGLALVIGSGGIGTQIAEDLSCLENELDVVLCGRKKNFSNFWEFDIEDNISLENLRNRIHDHPKKLRLVLNATGRLHSERLNPEKRLQHINKENLIESFSINSSEPALFGVTLLNFISSDESLIKFIRILIIH